jgi:hypothetical protein
MGLRPWRDDDDFWDMSPAEFQETYIGYLAREDRRWFMTAWMVSHMLAPHVKKNGKPPQPDKLLGRQWPFAELYAAKVRR